jgi:hypothetical protein
MTALPLPCFPWPLSDARLALLKAAKASLDSPLKIVPVEAAYGSPGRVLCFGETPDWLCATAPIRPENVDSVTSIAGALNLCLGELEGWAPSEQFSEAWLLGKWLGGEVRKVREERWNEDIQEWEEVWA